jgi:hypothetical protein
MKEFSLLKKFNWELLNSPIPAPVIPPYKVYTALITQSGGDNPFESYGDESITKGVTYTILSNPDNNNLIPFGAPNNTVGTTFVATVTGPLNYTMSLSLLYNQGAPIVNVLENTIGDITWTYSSVGEYTCNSSGLFTLGKTINTIDQTVNISGYGDGIYTAYLNNINVNTLRFAIYTYPGLNNVDDCLLDKFIEIRVYN